jgi:hypothetical protein
MEGVVVLYYNRRVVIQNVAGNFVLGDISSRHVAKLERLSVLDQVFVES